jgi:hypothetical protein
LVGGTWQYTTRKLDVRNKRKVETRGDRRALARHAGLGPVSLISVLAGALAAFAVTEILVTVGGAIAVAVNGGTNFSALSDRQFKTVVGVILVVAVFLSFALGGYVSGRMSRRAGASHGLLAGVAGVVLAALAAWVVVATGTDAGLAHVARHMRVTDTWGQWRSFGMIGALVLAAAMVLGGLAGGVEGETWHGKLLTRAVDPNYGPEADDRAEARRRITDAEVARLASVNTAGRVTAAGREAAGRERPAAAPTRTPEPTRAMAAPNRDQDRTRVVSGDEAAGTGAAPRAQTASGGGANASGETAAHRPAAPAEKSAAAADAREPTVALAPPVAADAGEHGADGRGKHRRLLSRH